MNNKPFHFFKLFNFVKKVTISFVRMSKPVGKAIPVAGKIIRDLWNQVCRFCNRIWKFCNKGLFFLLGFSPYRTCPKTLVCTAVYRFCPVPYPESAWMCQLRKAGSS